jgi:hypothetical protein
VVGHATGWAVPLNYRLFSIRNMLVVILISVATTHDCRVVLDA